MDLILDKFYILVVEGATKNLTYYCKITKTDSDSITFIDKYNQVVSYKKSRIISSVEVKK